MKTATFLLLLILTQAKQITASTVFVSSSGTNAPGYGTMLNPYYTIQYAHDHVNSGDTIKVKGGTYNIMAGVIISKSVTITKYGTGEVILDAGSWSGSYKHIFNIRNSNHVTIDSLALVNCIGIGSAAFYINGAGDSIVITRCRIRNIGYQSNDLITPPSNSANHNAHAIHVVGDAVNPISHCIISKCYISNCATGYSEAVTLTGYVDSFLVEKNFIDSIQNIGIVAAGNYVPPSYNGNNNPAKNQARNGIIRGNMVSHCMSSISFSAGIYIDGGINCKVEGNICFQNGVGISLGAERPIPLGIRVFGNIVDNNVVFGNATAGIFIGDTSPTPIYSNVVSNNTFYKNRTGVTINGISQVGTQTASMYGDTNGGEIHLLNNDSTLLQNNIIHAINGHQNLLVLNPYYTTHYKSDYNLYYTDAGTISLEIAGGVGSFNGSTTGGYFTISNFRSMFGLDSNSIQADPKYVNPSAGNFSLKPGSLAINSGKPTYDTTYSGLSDYNGNARVINGRIDIGALESLCPRATAVASGATTFCQGDSVMLNGNNGLFYTYQWQLNGTNISGATAAVYYADSMGSYKVIIQSNGCSDTSTAIPVTIHLFPMPVITRAGGTLTSGVTGVSYTWFLNGVVVAASATDTPRQNGIYTVQVMDANGCQKLSAPYTVNYLGVGTPAATFISIFPNPVRSKAYIKSDIPVSIKVFDLAGKMLLANNRAGEIDMSAFCDGTYLFVITGKNGEWLSTRIVSKTAIR